jgi:8-oxo-dGTP pyrophosphatase MutT (NUDIX family)
MVGSSILPVTFHKNKLYFLFGKETPLETSAPGWSDFGGGMEPGESKEETALREGGEELTGFLGNPEQLKRRIASHGGMYHINYKDQYHVHVIYIPYDENLPKYYNLNHQFLWERMNQSFLKKTKLFEKIEIQWFSEKATLQRRTEFRPFYQNIVDVILKETKNIRKYFMYGRRTGQRAKLSTTNFDSSSEKLGAAEKSKSKQIKYRKTQKKYKSSV